jgi:hypothetical protein
VRLTQANVVVAPRDLIRAERARCIADVGVRLDQCSVVFVDVIEDVAVGTVITGQHNRPRLTLILLYILLEHVVATSTNTITAAIADTTTKAAGATFTTTITITTNNNTTTTPTAAIAACSTHTAVCALLRTVLRTLSPFQGVRSRRCSRC